MDRRLVIVLATIALLPLSGSAALADPPVLSAIAQPDQARPSAEAAATAPALTTIPVATIRSSEPTTATTSIGANTNDPASSGTTNLSGPGMRASAPVNAAKGSGTPSATSPSTTPPTATSHAAAPVDSSGTSLDTRDQTLALRTSGTSAGGTVSDPSSVESTASFCILAHATESSGTPTADVSSICGGGPSTVGGSAATDAGGNGTGSSGLGGSACVVGSASGGVPATASATSACNASTASNVSGTGNAAGSDGTAITPQMRASVCTAARSSAQLSSTAEFSSVCGATTGTTPSNGASTSSAATARAAENAWTPNASAGGGTPPGDGAAFGTGIQLPGLPSTSTTIGISFLGVLLSVAGVVLLLRSRKTI